MKPPHSKALPIVAGALLGILGFWVAAFGGLGALFVLGATDGTPKSDAVKLALIGLGGVVLMGSGVWVIIRGSR